jgi:hypothetical protein
MKKLLLAVIIMQLLGCSNESSSERKSANSSNVTPMKTYPVKPVTRFEDNGDDTGWWDFGISIVSVSEGDSSTTYKLLSTWENGKNLGLLVEVPKKDGDMGYGKSLKLKSIGPESDNLIHFMAKLYSQKQDSSSRFAKEISVDYVNMNSFAKTLGSKNKNDTSVHEYKLFFQGTNKDDYAELYLNINDSAKRIDIKEKDQEYRPLIIKFLGK